MAEYDRTARNLDTAYVLSFFIQLAAIAIMFIGLLARSSDCSVSWGFWLCLGGSLCFASFIAGRWYINRWFRRRWPIN
jgi:hypothetical protein